MFRKLKLAIYVALGLIMLPFVLAAAYIMKRAKRGQIIDSAVRTSRDGLQTATLTFEKPDQDQTVKLYGMIHVGQPGFYKEISDGLDADEADGHTILYEKVTKPTDEELKALTRDERALHEALKGLGASQTEMARTLGLVHQMDEIKLKETWVHSDLTQIEFIRLLIAGKLTNFVIRMFGQLSRAAKRRDLFGHVINWAMRTHVIFAVVALLFMLPKYRRFKSIILDHRNQVAHDGIMKALQTSNRASATWGAAHLPGMAKMLADEGFALIDTEWHTAFTFKRQSFIDLAQAIGRRLVEGIKEWFDIVDDEEAAENETKSAEEDSVESDQTQAEDTQQS